MLNLRLTQPDALIDIARVAELRRAEERPSSIVLGAAVRHAEIEDGLVPDASNGLMRRTARGLAYRAVRNRGTLDKGGALLYLARAERLMIKNDAVVSLECLALDARCG